MDAEADLEAPAMIENLLSFKEIEASIQKVKLFREEFDTRHQLDAIDWSICGVSGSLAALVDISLVWMPRHPGFLGGKAPKAARLQTGSGTK